MSTRACLALVLLACLSRDANLAPGPDDLRACPALAHAAAPRRAHDETRRCEASGPVREAFARSDEPDENELARLRRTVEEATAKAPEACSAELGALLAEATTCGARFDAVAVRIVASRAVEGSLAADVLLRPGACQWKLVSALREAERIDPSVALAVWEMTRGSDPDVRAAAWLTLGTLERTAKGAGQADVASCVDHAIGGALAKVGAEDRPLMLAAAGNAGCEACRGAAHGATRSEDPSLRKSGALALRFSPEKDDVDALCGVVRTDVDPTVRASAAFALRHGEAHLEARLACLHDAASDEENDHVADDAIGSLAALADRSQLAVGTLVHVARSARLDSARARARDELRVFASEEAIASAVDANQER
jgi:hypothetical protein